MENEHVVPAQETAGSKKDNSRLKKIIIAFTVAILLILIAGLSYYFGSRREGSKEISPTPTREPLATQTPSPTPEEIQEGTPSPTKKPTSTPSPSPTSTLKTKVLSSQPSLDGFRSSNGGGNSSLEIRAGRNVNLVTRGFASFDLSGLPAGAKIQAATLRLYQAKIIGNPYSVGGSIKVDHLTYGDSLDNVDYGTAALSSSFTTLTSNAVIEWKDADSTDSVRDDVANARSRSQFRIHFQIENTGGDVTGDFTYFEAAENSQGTGNTPQLVVKYY